jgi:hypothetical protein
VDPNVEQQYQAMSNGQLQAEYTKLERELARSRRDHDAPDPGDTLGDLSHMLATRPDDPLWKDREERIAYVDHLLGSRGVTVEKAPVGGPGDDGSMQMTVTDDSFTPSKYAPELSSSDDGPSQPSEPTTAAGGSDEATGSRSKAIAIVVAGVVVVAVAVALVAGLSGGSSGSKRTASVENGGTTAAPTTTAAARTSSSSTGGDGVTESSGSSLVPQGSDLVYSIHLPDATGSDTVVVDFTGPGLPSTKTLDVPASGVSVTFPGVVHCGATWGATIHSIDGKALSGYVPQKTDTDVCVNAG